MRDFNVPNALGLLELIDYFAGLIQRAGAKVRQAQAENRDVTDAEYEEQSKAVDDKIAAVRAQIAAKRAAV